MTKTAQALRVGSLPSYGCDFFPLEAQNERVLMIGSCLLRAPVQCEHEVARFGTGAHLPWMSPDAAPEHLATGGSAHAPIIFNAEVRSAS